jgi:large subunit ribosomal protein L25
MAEQFVSLARQLPTRLQTFFAKYPPGTCNTARTNPFKPTVHTVTGKWHNPVFSYRRQAELCKMARKWGVEELLPHSKKRSDIREEQRLKRIAKGIHVKGTKEERTLKARYVESLGRIRRWEGGELGRWGWIRRGRRGLRGMQRGCGAELVNLVDLVEPVGSAEPVRFLKPVRLETRTRIPHAQSSPHALLLAFQGELNKIQNTANLPLSLQTPNAYEGYGEHAQVDRGMETSRTRKRMEGMAQWKGPVLNDFLGFLSRLQNWWREAGVKGKGRDVMISNGVVGLVQYLRNQCMRFNFNNYKLPYGSSILRQHR